MLFVPEPLRCYRCQRWGHHQRRCTLPARCRVCSGTHNTVHCLSLHKRKQKAAACCPNCRGKHHAWNLSLPSRKAQVSRMHNGQQPKHPKQSSKKDETNQGKKGKQPIHRKKQPTQKPQVKPSGQQLLPKVQRPTMRKKIQLEGKAVNRSTAAAPEPPQSLPLEQLRPPMLTLAEEYAKAAAVNWDKDHLGLMVEATLALQGLGHLSKVQEDLPPTPAKNGRLDLPRHLPWEMTASDFSSETESDYSDYERE